MEIADIPNHERKKVALVLSDGSIFSGRLLGSEKESAPIAEVIFNTSLSGYQEIITDPSYRGQFVVFTYPSIGNYGINDEDDQSYKPWLEGIIVRDYCRFPSNHRSRRSLERYLLDHGLSGITGVDTRALVRHIREKGSLMGGIFELPPSGDFESGWLKNALREISLAGTMEGKNLTDVFDGSEANEYVNRRMREKNLDASSMLRIAALDFGIKFSILECFLDVGILPEVFKGDMPLEKWSRFDISRYDGFFFSNGPGDPAAVSVGIENIRKILESNKPSFGICLGHQMVSNALGGSTYKMKFGHHGANQPVKASHRKNVMITAQNHGFAADEQSLQDFFLDKQNSFETNPNDNSAEGFRLLSESHNVISVQYHPEASPGPHDARIVFQEFKDLLLKNKPQGSKP